MTWWEAALLGLLQGLTEFLPVSSSGHLVLGEYVLGLPQQGDVVFEVFVHFGTVLSILTVYRGMLWRIVRTCAAALVRPGELRERYRSDEDLRLVAYVGITLVPTGLAYVLFRDAIEAAFAAPRLAAGMLLVTGMMLLFTTLRRDPGGKLSPLRSLVIGIAQSFAMIPGISRSGATICTALYLDVSPGRAADFSFLMLLPVVLGGTALKAAEVLGSGAIDAVPLVTGTAVAFGSGIIAILLVLDFVRRGRLRYFAWYCFAVGIVGLALIP